MQKYKYLNVFVRALDRKVDVDLFDLCDIYFRM